MMFMNLDTDLLRNFLAIVDTGNFTRAAERVGRTQSAVSMQMKRLEETLGKPLLLRDKRKVRLTPDGETLVGFAQRMIDLNDAALSRLTEPELTGQVRLGIPDDYVARFLPSVLAEFSNKHPQVELEVRTDPSLSLDTYLAEGELDLALLSCAAVEDHGELIHREPMVWVTGANHGAHEQSPLPLATTEPYCQMRRNALAVLDHQGVDYRIAYISRSYLGLATFVLAGLAVSHVGESSVVPGMRVLGEADGFPDIGSVDVGLKRGRGPRSAAVESLAESLTRSLKSAAVLEG
ncbi:MAG: LysR family transcriptional regulator [Rhodospirillaceae bacterium]|nr:LysR family transcriptional regulator [Rhodospirillaceae bacterium]